MALLEVIGEMLTTIFVEIIFKGIILRTLNFISKGFNFIWRKITGNTKPANKTWLLFVPLLLTSIIFISCDTAKTLYKSSTSAKEYLTIKAVNLPHCGCTELYADYFKNGKLSSQVFYNDRILRKTIFDYTNNSKSPQTNSLLATTGEGFAIPFDSLDLKIIEVIQTSNIRLQGFVYPLRLSQFKGYITDTLLSRQ